VPPAGELTVAETLQARFTYPEPVALGQPFAVGADWEYERETTGGSYSFGASDVTANVHVATSYQIDAPDVVRLYRKEPFVVKAQFFGLDDRQFRGADLFVQCFLAGPQGQYRRFVLQDDGIRPDDGPNDGVFTGIYWFQQERPDPRGLWMFYVIAQDVNAAQPDLPPEEAAKIIGGMVLTHQLTISFSGGSCPLVPDGDVRVI
jgi:hypothetical protein